MFSKVNRIVLKLKSSKFPSKLMKSSLNGILVQDRDLHVESQEDFKAVTVKTIDDKNDIEDIIFANKIVKHSRSNAIVLAKTNSC